MALTLAAGGAAAQDKYPSKPIRLIVSFPPGGPLDVMARLTAQYLSGSLGQMIVDNKPGAGGTLAGREAARAEPDGYTLLFGSSATLAIGPALYGNSGYDPVKSFAPIAMVSSVPYVMIGATNAPLQDRAGAARLRQGQPGHAQFRRAERRAAAHAGGNVQDADRRRHSDRAVQGRLDADHRHDRGPHPRRLRDHLGDARPSARGQHPRPRRAARRPHRRASRRADHGRKRRERRRRLVVVGHAGAGRHARRRSSRASAPTSWRRCARRISPASSR